MTVLRELPSNLFRDRRATVGTLLGGKKPWCYVNEILNWKLKRNLESCFIITDPSIDFYQTWWNTTQRILGNINEIPDMYHAEIEEYALDMMYTEMKYDIRYKLLTHQYQIGERYPVTKRTNTDNVYFHHNHLYESEENFSKYIKKVLEKIKK